jgi:DNA-directed RNA polymerase specialized sigma24 family protein
MTSTFVPSNDRPGATALDATALDATALDATALDATVIKPRATNRTTMNLGGRLTREWTRLRLHPGSHCRAAGWGLVDGTLHDLDQVLAAVGYEVERTTRTEAALRQLVIIARTDELAARVVVQRLIPGLLAVVRRRAGGQRASECFEELLSAAWISIRTFNPSRQPSTIAASLISDAEYLAFRSARRRRSSLEQPTEFDADSLAAPVIANAVEELAELLELARRSHIRNEDLAFVQHLLDAATLNDAARAMQITPRTLRNRRDRVTSELRRLALAA